MAVGGDTPFNIIKVMLEAGTSEGAPKAPGSGGGKPPAPPSLDIRKRVGGAAKAVAGKIPGGGAVSAVAGKIPKPDPKLMSMAGQSLKHGAATAAGAGKAAGVQAGLASILKQSQLFTGVIGTIFQIVGMLVDVIIMPFMPIIIPVIKMLAWTVPKVMWVTQKLQVGIQAVVDAIGWFFGKVGDGIGWIINSQWVKSMIDGIWSGIMAVWNKITWWSGPLHPFKAMFETIKGIINIIITVFKAAWSIAKVIIQGVWDIIKVIFSAYKAIFKLYFEIIKAVINLYITIFKTAWGIAKSVIEGIWGFIQTAYSGIKEFISGVFDGAKAFFSGLWEPFKSGLDSAIEFVKGIPDKIWGYIQNIWGFIKAWIGLYVAAILLIKDWTIGIFQKIKDFFLGVWSTVKEWFSTAKQWIIDKIKDWASNFISAIIAVKDWTVGIFQKIKDFFIGAWNTAKEWFGTARQWIIDKIKDWATNFISAIIAIKDFAVGIFQKIKDFFIGTWNTAKEWFTTARQWIIDKIKEWAANFIAAIIVIKDFAVGVFQKIKDLVSSTWETAKSWFTTARQWVIDKLKTWLANFVSGVLLIKDKVIAMVEKIKEVITGVWIMGKNWFLERIANVKTFFTGIWEKAKEIITFLKDTGAKIFNKIDTIRLKILDIITSINPLNWIPKIVEKIKAIIPTPGELVENIPGVGTVKNVASKLKFWQHGAIVSKPTLGVAGESGPEIIAPLKVLGTLKFLPPIFQGVKAIAGMIPKLGELVHVFSAKVKEAFGYVLRDALPKITKLLTTIGQIGEAGLDLFGKIGEAIFKQIATQLRVIDSSILSAEVAITTGMSGLSGQLKTLFSQDGNTQTIITSAAVNISDWLSALHIQGSNTQTVIATEAASIVTGLTSLHTQGVTQLGYLATITTKMADVNPIKLDIQNIYSYLPTLNTSIRAVESAAATRPAVNVTVVNQTAERIDTSQSSYQSTQNSNQSNSNQDVLFDDMELWR